MQLITHVINTDMIHEHGSKTIQRLQGGRTHTGFFGGSDHFPFLLA